MAYYYINGEIHGVGETDEIRYKQIRNETTRIVKSVPYDATSERVTTKVNIVRLLPATDLSDQDNFAMKCVLRSTFEKCSK